MKKILMIIIICLTSFILVACQKNEMKVAILIYDELDTFMTEYLSEITSKFDERIIYEVSYSNKSQADQNRQFNEYIDKKFDLIIINAVDRLASNALIDKADQALVPVIFINREPTAQLSESKYSYYVGANSIGMGILQAEMIYDEYLNSNITDHNQDDIYQILILKGEQGHQDAENRSIKVIEKLTELNFNFEILEIRVANWDRQLAYEESKKAFSSFNHIDIIISNNDDMALGAIDYLQSERKKVDVSIFGVDATKAGIDAYNEGTLTGTVVNDFKRQAIYIGILTNYLLFNEELSHINYENKFNYINGYIYK